MFPGVLALPAVRGVGSGTLGQRQRAAKEHDVSVAGQSTEVAEEPATHKSTSRLGQPLDKHLSMHFTSTSSSEDLSLLE